MAKIRTSRTKKAPEGFKEIESTLKEFEERLKEAEAAPHDGKKKNEALWEIFQIHHQRSRYVYELYYKKKAISSALYDWLLKQKYADANLIAKWKKQGYENLCCLQCIQSTETNHGSTCICRVPRDQLKTSNSIQCVTCGCRGCASSD